MHITHTHPSHQQYTLVVIPCLHPMSLTLSMQDSRLASLINQIFPSIFTFLFLFPSSRIHHSSHRFFLVVSPPPPGPCSYLPFP